jgi:hypothetical protein
MDGKNVSYGEGFCMGWAKSAVQLFVGSLSWRLKTLVTKL